MIRLIGILSLAILLTSCSTVAPPAAPSTVAPAKRAVRLDQVHHWTLQGKVAVQTAQDAGSATIDWMQRGRQFNITLTGPMGSNAIRLAGRPGLVTLTDSNGKQVSASSPEDLLARAWGFHLPVSHLDYWIRGLPVPGSTSNPQYDKNGRLSSLSQQGWNVQFLSYTTVNGIDLPSRLAITSAAMKVKLIIYSWVI